jgi:hypothetical protein
MATLSLSQILIIIAVIVGIILVMRLIQPKLSPPEKYLFYEIQRKSPQMDNLRLVMWIKMVVHPVNSDSDLDYQTPYLEDPQKIKLLTDQMSGFGASSLLPLFGYEAITWKLDPFKENPLMLRMAAIILIRHFPHTAEVVEDLMAHAPDSASANFFNKDKKSFLPAEQYRARYAFNLYKTLNILTSTTRNEWWPGTNPDIREWAVYVLSRISKAFPEVNFSTFSTILQ